MILFGTRCIKSTIDKGAFDCPTCASKQSYKHKTVKRFITLYLIPAIPREKVGEIIECQGCKSTFTPDVLEFRRQQSDFKFLAEYEKALRHALVMLTLADGVVTEEEITTVQQIINKFTHNNISLQELELYIQEVRANPEPVSTYLSRVTPPINKHGKEIIIRCALSTARSDQFIAQVEIDLIKEMGKAMSMSDAHLNQILSEYV